MVYSKFLVWNVPSPTVERMEACPFSGKNGGAYFHLLCRDLEARSSFYPSDWYKLQMARPGSLVDAINWMVDRDHSISRRLFAALFRAAPYLSRLKKAVAPKSLLTRAIVAVGIVGLAAAARWAMEVLHLLEGHPLITFYPAIIVVTLLLGFLPGFISVISAAILAWCLFFLPAGAAWVFPLLLFVISSGFMVTLVSLLISALEHAFAHALLLRNVIESTQHGVMLVDVKGRLAYANGTAEKLFGYTRSRLMRQHIEKLVALNFDEKYASSAATCAKWSNTQAKGRRKNGIEFPVEIGRIPITVGGTKYILITALDISDRLRLAELRRVARLTTMGEMVASIGHEISQPVSAIAANSSAALRWINREPLNLDEARLALKRIANDASRSSHIITTLRSMLSKDSQKIAKLDINKLVRDVVALVRSEIQTGEISLCIELSEGLPPVNGDAIQLEQVILNLIMNAVESLALVGDGPRALAIRSEKQRGGVKITVEDSGPGIPPETLERVFDAFFSTKPGGMGIGLSICRSIVEAHGGKIAALAPKARGCLFEITLPKNL